MLPGSPQQSRGLVRMVVLQTGQYFHPCLCRNAVPSRYREPVTLEELDALSCRSFATTTESSIRWATRLFSLWKRNRQQQSFDPVIKRVEFEVCHALEKSDVEYTLRRFVVEVRKANGDDYPGKTLYTLLVLLQFKLEKHGYHWKILNGRRVSRPEEHTGESHEGARRSGVGSAESQPSCHSHSHQQALGVWRPWRRYAGEIAEHASNADRVPLRLEGREGVARSEVSRARFSADLDKG